MIFEENKTLFGHDPSARILAVEFDGGHGMELLIRTDDGAVKTEHATLRPFLWSATPLESQGVTMRRLEGDLPLGFLAECESWPAFVKLRAGLKGSGVKTFALSDPVQQYLLASGRTLFKKMEFTDLRRMQLAADGSAITVADHTGWQETIEHDVAERLTAIIRDRDPDVIEGHDLFKKILPAVTARARNAKVKLAWGRDGALLASRASRIQIAEKTINYPKFEVHGRHFVDTFLLAQFYDVSARELESFELADVASHCHCEGKDAICQTRELAAMLGASYFVQTKIFPYNYQDVVVRGNATKIDALLLREYFRRGHSIPDLPEARAFEGGYTDIFFTGVARNVWHCDIASLYPSVMLRFDCFPAQDRLQIFRGLLTDLRKFRLEAKAAMRGAATANERAGANALQTTFKILINSFYGYLGFAQAHFADFDAAARITQTGRDLLKQMVVRLQQLGAQVIEIDTDGIYFVPPATQKVEGRKSGIESADEAGLDALQRELQDVLPGGIEIEFDERYEAMFSYKAKNYALLTADNELILRGGALKSRGLEKFQRVFLEQMIRLLMEEKPNEIAKLRADFESKIRQREWPIEWLMKTDTLQDSLAQYGKKIEGSSRNRAAAYELALKSGRNYQPGDQVSYYITGTKKNVAAYENSRLAIEWTASERDENIEYYAAKLNELTKKFAPFLTAPAPSSEEEPTLF